MLLCHLFWLCWRSWHYQSLAAAQGPGVRAGASVDPDQFYLGGHYESNALVERLHFKPNAEIGFGDDLTTVGLNLEFVYKIPVLGPVESVRRWPDPPSISIRSTTTANAEGGLNFLFGAETLARSCFSK